MELFSLTDIKKKNLSDVYHYIYRNEGCAKQTIANALNMSLPTVTQHLTTLSDAHLIEKCGQLSSNVGRKAAAYRAVSTAKIAIGIEILAWKVYIVALNLHGKKEKKETFPLEFSPTESYFENLAAIVKDFIERMGYEESQILGIGLGIQGLVSRDGSTITYGKILECTGLTIDLFSRHFSYPCRFVHDPECAANSELWENPDISDAIYISLGYHLGGAVIINRELQPGLTGKTGTFEHMTLVPDGLSCYCGQKGCAECYCSGSSLLENDMKLEDFFAGKKTGNLQLKQKWADYLTYLASFIHNLHKVLECTVILGGHITPYLTEEDIDYLKMTAQNLCAFGDDASYIVAGQCRVDAVSIGAAIPFVKEFLENIGM